MVVNMGKNIVKWVWQDERYPEFPYNFELLKDVLAKIEYNRGVLDGLVKVFKRRDIKELEIDALVAEALYTSEIEGEFFERSSVRSSVRKKLDENFNLDKDSSTHRSDALVAVLIDANINSSPLTLERLHGWHNALFSSGYDLLSKINVATFREDDNMEVVSGAIGHEKVHYKAPPVKNINSDIDRFLKWCSSSQENVYIKSALAHLWFVVVHPYDDGNGRIARAISDYILADIFGWDFKLFSFSSAINSDRKGYYSVLDRTTNLILNRGYDFTSWVEWYLKTLNSALESALINVESVIAKTKFWDRCRDKKLNTRQLKVLNKIWDNGGVEFEGGLSTKKYMAIAKTSRATAVRDINELLEYGCIERVEGRIGRGVRYVLSI